MDTKYISIGIPIIASIVSIVVAFTTVKDANKYIQIEVNEIKEEHIKEIEKLQDDLQSANIDLLEYKVNEMKATQNSILDDIEELKENH